MATCVVDQTLHKFYIHSNDNSKVTKVIQMEPSFIIRKSNQYYIITTNTDIILMEILFALNEIFVNIPKEGGFQCKYDENVELYFNSLPYE
jgi:hypothetical protein